MRIELARTVDGTAWMLAILEIATILELAHVHMVLAMEMG